MEKEGLKLDDKIGSAKDRIAQAYRGKNGGIPPTEEQIDILRDEYGISLEKKENVTQVFIGKLEILKRFGIDTSKITTRDTIETLARKAGLDATNLDKLKKEGLRLDDKIGISKNAIALASRGIGNYTPPTKEQIDILKDEYGISLEKKKTKSQDMGKATFDVDAPQCQEATEVIEALIKEKHNEAIAKRKDVQCQE